MSKVVFNNKRLNREKLLLFGFAERKSRYAYSTSILDGQMQMLVVVADNGDVEATVIDSMSRDEYVLHHTSGASGAFVSSVRAEYEQVLREISEKCFEVDVFKSDYARKIIHYVRDAYGDEMEYLWQRFPDNAVLRRRDNAKWYAALLTVQKKKLGLNGEGSIEILDLRMKPEDIEMLVDGKRYLPGYHMNKRHWYTICLDGSVPIAEIFRRIDASYALALKRK